MIEYYDDISSFSEDDWYEALRLVMPKPYNQLGEETLDRLFERALMQLPEGEKVVVVESLGNIAKSIGRFASQNAGTIGSIGGGILGTVIGGPAGTAVGASLGGALGNTIGAATGGTPPQAPPQTAPPRNVPTPQPRQTGSFRPPQGQVPRAPAAPIPTQLAPARPQQTAIASNRPETRLLMMTSNVQFLIQVVQAVVESLLRTLLDTTGRSRPLPEPENGQEEGFVPLEEFSNAIAVYGEELSIKHAATSNLGEGESNYSSPKERADSLFEQLYP